MILPAQAPLEPFGWPLRALYVALNSPVVTLESLPTGPASAAVALHDEGASLCVRSVRSGQIQWFVTTEDLHGDRRVAVDAALSFAESMGFLFDDDEVARRGDAGSAEAVAIWRALCGEESRTGDADAPELELDLASSEAVNSRIEVLLTETLPPPDAPRADLAPAAVLTKFRRVADLEPECDDPETGAPVDLRLRLMSRF